LWVAPRGTDNLIRSSAFLPASWEKGVRAVPGVAAVDPILRAFVVVGLTGSDPTKISVLTIAHRTPGGLGEPWLLDSGRQVQAADEVVLDRATASRLGVALGTTIDVAGEKLRLVGVSRGTNLLATQLAFADYGRAEEVFGTFGRASFLLVRLAPGAGAGEAGRRIQALLPLASVLTRDQFVANNLREVSAGFVPLIVLITALGLTVATLLVGLLVQGLVEDRRSDLAVLLALGSSANALARSVLVHISSLVLIGATCGVVASRGLGLALDRFVPTIDLVFRVSDVAAVIAIFLAAGLLAAALPVLRLRRIDPLEAFRA
jgi:putative ABC transport system permease protein